MPATGNFLTSKVGPLPAYGWGLLAAGGAYLWMKHKQGTGATAATPTSAVSGYPTSSDASGILPFGGSGGGAPIIVIPGLGQGTSSGGAPGGPGPTPNPITTGLGGSSPAPSAASLLGFSNPNTPVAMVAGKLIDTVTGRPAYYGPGGQPGSATSFAGASSWQQPGGAMVYYNPQSYAYGDPNRLPNTPPVAPLFNRAPVTSGAISPI